LNSLRILALISNIFAVIASRRLRKLTNTKERTVMSVYYDVIMDELYVLCGPMKTDEFFILLGEF
jgi:hypothetical protein